MSVEEDWPEFEYDSGGESDGMCSIPDPVVSSMLVDCDVESRGASCSPSSRAAGAAAPPRTGYATKLSSPCGLYSWSVFPESAVARMMRECVQECGNMFAAPFDDTMLILAAYAWRREKVEELWWGEGETAVRDFAGVRAGDDPPVRPLDLAARSGSTRADTFTCPVTLGDVPVGETDALPCGHWASCEAWRGVVAAAIAEPLTVLNATCIETDCNERVRPRMFHAYLPQDLSRKYDEYVTRAFAAKAFAFCPGPGCTDVVRYLDGGAVDVTCTASHTFCFACKHMPSHKPATCEEVAVWSDASVSMKGADAEYLAEHTKGCPKCRQRIERSSGCNKVVCSACHESFCWVCLRYPFASAHNYPAEAWDCNVAVDFSKLGKEDRSMKQLAWYGQRASNHKDTAEYVERHGEQWASLSQELQDVLPLTKSDVAVIDSTLAALLRARNVCRWSYVHGYFLACRVNEAQDAVEAEANRTTVDTNPIFRPPRLPSWSPASADTSQLAKWLQIQHLFSDIQGRLEGYVETLANLMDPAEIVRKLGAAKGEVGIRMIAAATTATPSTTTTAANTAAAKGGSKLPPPPPPRLPLSFASPALALENFMDLRKQLENFGDAISKFSANLLHYVEGGYDVSDTVVVPTATSQAGSGSGVRASGGAGT